MRTGTGARCWCTASNREHPPTGPTTRTRATSATPAPPPSTPATDAPSSRCAARSTTSRPTPTTPGRGGMRTDADRIGPRHRRALSRQLDTHRTGPDRGRHRPAAGVLAEFLPVTARAVSWSPTAGDPAERRRTMTDFSRPPLGTAAGQPAEGVRRPARRAGRADAGPRPEPAARPLAATVRSLFTRYIGNGLAAAADGFAVTHCLRANAGLPDRGRGRWPGSCLVGGIEVSIPAPVTYSAPSRRTGVDDTRPRPAGPRGGHRLPRCVPASRWTAQRTRS